MDELLKIINNSREYNDTAYAIMSSMPIGDILRFNYNMWPFPDATKDEENKYFDQKYIIMNKKYLRSLQILINMHDDIYYNYESLIESLRIELPRHSTLIRTLS